MGKTDEPEISIRKETANGDLSATFSVVAALVWPAVSNWIRMNITTRSPTDSDKEFVQHIHDSGYRDVVVSQFGTWDQAKQDEFFENKWSNANLKILMVNGAPCGFATVEDHPQEMRLVELVVCLEYQNRGIGSAFLHKLIEQAEIRRVPVRLQVLVKSHAINLYHKLGFKEYDRTVTHVLMERSIN